MRNHAPITHQEQLDRWVAGESIHRISGVTGGECTPDFSCCKPELLADEPTRQAFAAASESERFKFLGAFLGAAIALVSDKKVHIAGSDPGDQS
jgi:hypothetical protein